MVQPYREVHAKRFDISLEFLIANDVLKDGISILNLGGASVFKSMIRDKFDVIFNETSCDLRYDIPDDNEYDLILCMEVIEHIKDQDSKDVKVLGRYCGTGVKNLITESKRLLRDGGFFFLTTPHLFCYKTLHNWLTKKKSLMTWEGHPRELPPEYIKWILSAHFDEITEQYFNCWGDHGLPEGFTEEMASMLQAYDLSNRVEDNVFFLCK